MKMYMKKDDWKFNLLKEIQWKTKSWCVAILNDSSGIWSHTYTWTGDSFQHFKALSHTTRICNFVCQCHSKDDIMSVLYEWRSSRQHGALWVRWVNLVPLCSKLPMKGRAPTWCWTKKIVLENPTMLELRLSTHWHDCHSETALIHGNQQNICMFTSLFAFFLKLKSISWTIIFWLSDSTHKITTTALTNWARPAALTLCTWPNGLGKLLLDDLWAVAALEFWRTARWPVCLWVTFVETGKLLI